ncbi:pyridoxal phosphate-dependent transferase [Boeremia exigua]|uniref:pyridoxal phosphate-dependent transferase n=1 Tax=Boeremia exigua TaxID=749465 RepID=UPI001E8D0487|nr:pyridoxal phosphate-dependent transferase [Boeremia exigua]KAH6612180.1 pyridoxal phosphate-dependent transferase [Boeremia exigua]
MSTHGEEIAEVAAAEHRLSKRGAYNATHRDIWGPREKAMGNPWSPDNTGGTVILRLAENSLLHEEIVTFTKTQATHPTDHLTYSTGPRGSRRLQHAAAAFLNEVFESNTVITPHDIFVTSGLASALDTLTWAICDEGDGILIPQPYYNGFDYDLMNRSRVRVVGIPYEGIDGYSRLDDLFNPGVNRRAVERALQKARQCDITIRALMISNPHNPLGRCYPAETLMEFAALCGENGLHLISDEIYALSVFSNPAASGSTRFTSLMSLNLNGNIDASLLHILYGASKDFCANGFRLGFVCTKNKGVITAMSSIGMCLWSPHIIQDVWAGMLSNRQWMDAFMSRKHILMERNYAIVSSFLKKNGIEYFEMNAGLFVWIDLRRFMPTANDDGTVHNAGCSRASINQKEELEFAQICMQTGVLVAPSHLYGSEELGWFRITFTLSSDALEEGLRRLWIALQLLSTKGSQAVAM